jgi:dynein light intermediate chain 2
LVGRQFRRSISHFVPSFFSPLLHCHRFFFEHVLSSVAAQQQQYHMAATDAPASPTEEAKKVEGEESLAFTTERPKPVIDASKDLWQNIAANVKDAIVEPKDKTVLVVGARHSGKTSIIYRMLGMSQTPKPSTALEYSYGKREDRNATMVAHFWELAHGPELAQLSDVVLTPENIHTALTVIVIDCANPGTMWSSLEFWLRRLDRRAQEIFGKMRSRNSGTPDKLLASLKERIGEGHPDLDKMRLSGLPIVIVASRLDMWKEDTVKLKTMVRTLRHMAHLYGACLICTSDREAEAIKLRALLSHLIFGLPFDNKFVNADHEKGGVLLPAGKDSFVDIGEPAHVDLSKFKPCGDPQLDRWKAPFDEAFPPKADVGSGAGAHAATQDADAFAAELYDVEKGAGEPAVDAVRRQMDEELELYRKSAKKEREMKKDKGGSAAADEAAAGAE